MEIKGRKVLSILHSYILQLRRTADCASLGLPIDVVSAVSRASLCALTSTAALLSTSLVLDLPRGLE